MAFTSPSAKSAKDWTSNDLLAYNIVIEVQDATTFFRGQGPSSQSLLNHDSHHAFLSNVSATDIVDDGWFHVVRYMDMVMSPISAGEDSSVVVDFTKELLRMLGYHNRRMVLRSRKDLPLYVCGQWMHGTADVCVVDTEEGGGNDILLLVQQHRHSNPDVSDPRAQLIANAIAAFHSLNITRASVLGTPALEFKVMAGIVMTGTSPTFFKIPITASLVRAVRIGHQPNTPTIVAMHVPDVPRPARRHVEGMKPLDNRHNITACFEAFKTFVCW